MMFFNKETKDIYWQTELDEVARTNSRYFIYDKFYAFFSGVTITE